MLLTILIIVCFGYGAYLMLKGTKEHYLTPKESQASPSAIPNIVLTPRPISKFTQINYLVSDSNVLTYFSYKNGLLEMRFQDGTVFKQPLKDCVFQFGMDKAHDRHVSPKGSMFSWKVYEIGPILSKSEWSTVFSILSQAGTIYGAYNRAF